MDEKPRTKPEGERTLTDSDFYTQACSYFYYHAGQRTTMINFFIAVFGALSAPVPSAQGRLPFVTPGDLTIFAPGMRATPYKRPLRYYPSWVITRWADTGCVPPAEGVTVSDVSFSTGLRTVRTEFVAVVVTIAMPTICDPSPSRPTTV